MGIYGRKKLVRPLLREGPLSLTNGQGVVAGMRCFSYIDGGARRARKKNGFPSWISVRRDRCHRLPRDSRSHPQRSLLHKSVSPFCHYYCSRALVPALLSIFVLLLKAPSGGCMHISDPGGHERMDCYRKAKDVEQGKPEKAKVEGWERKRDELSACWPAGRPTDFRNCCRRKRRFFRRSFARLYSGTLSYRGNEANSYGDSYVARLRRLCPEEAEGCLYHTPPV